MIRETRTALLVVDADSTIVAADAGGKIAALARRLGMPRTTLHERVTRLEHEGVLLKKTSLDDYAKLGRPVTVYVFVLVGFASGGVDQRTLAQKVAEFPEVTEVFVISGEWGILLKARIESLPAVGRLIIDRLRAMPGVARTIRHRLRDDQGRTVITHPVSPAG